MEVVSVAFVLVAVLVAASEVVGLLEDFRVVTLKTACVSVKNGFGNMIE